MSVAPLEWPESLHASAALARAHTENSMTMMPMNVAPPSSMSVYDCIVAVSADIAQEGVAKTRKNLQQGYQFRGIDEVMNALAPLLAKHRLAILPRVLSRSVVERESKGGGALFYVTVEAEFDFVSACDGSKHTVKTYGEAMDSGDKATNKAMSAAYKYAAFQTFCIPTEGDNDADAQTHEPKGYVVQPPAPAPAPAPPPAPAPTGTVLIERVDTSPTKNPNVTKYLITDSNGQTFSTIKAQLGSLCEQLCQEQLPVTIESKQTKWGHDLVAVHPTERVIQIQHDVHSEPVTDKDIPF